MPSICIDGLKGISFRDTTSCMSMMAPDRRGAQHHTGRGLLRHISAARMLRCQHEFSCKSANASCAVPCVILYVQLSNMLFTVSAHASTRGPVPGFQTLQQIIAMDGAYGADVTNNNSMVRQARAPSSCILKTRSDGEHVEHVRMFVWVRPAQV
jgi:hypothetical protein